MNYSLGNTLSRGGSLNADGLSLDLQFATDKTLTARKGPTPTFTRASAATYYGPLVNFGGVNDFPTTAISNGRASWFKSEAGEDITISYTGTRWRVHVLSGETEVEYLAAVGSEWRPDQANWSASGAPSSVTTSSTFGLVTAAINEPRFDHATTAPNACRGLLIEESRTNLALRSEDFANGTWIKSFSSLSSNTSTAPDGTITADEFIEDSTTNGHTCVQNAATATIGTTYTFSVFVKRKDTSNQFLLIGASGLVTASFISINLTNGVTATGIGSPGSPINVSSTAYPNGWYRVQFSVVATSASAAVFDIRLSRDGTWATRSYLGDGVQSSLIWGAQVEAGSFPTSYIPTVASSVVRSADVCSITGASFTGFYNQSEGTMLVNASTPANGDRTVLATDDNTADEMIRLRTEGTNPFFKVTDGGSEVVAIDAGTVTVNTTFKLAGAYKLDDFAASINGSAAVTDTSGTIPTVDQMRIGAGQAGNTMCGCISSVRYYKKRLSDAKLVTLTT
jgi:hypothetical protein